MKTIIIIHNVKEAGLAYKPMELNEEIVVPVVMMVEGVHSGNHGSIYHSVDTLTSGVPYWENKPITLNHPQDDKGNFVPVGDVSADAWVIGLVKNARMEDNKLKADAHFDVQKLIALSPDVLEDIRNGKTMEVSIGVFAEEKQEDGIWNEEQYKAIALNHQPDHLALLPGEIGACSVMDGCGLSVNNEKKGGKTDVKVDLRLLNTNGMFASPIVYAEGLKERVEKVRTSLYARDSENEMHYLEEVFNDYAIFNQTVREGNTYKESLYKQSYTIGTNGEVSWSGSPTKVVREVKYKNINSNREETNMCEKCKEKAKALVANVNTHFTDDDLKWLEVMTEDKLDKLIPKVVVTNKTVEVEKEVTTERALEVLGINKQQYEKGLEIYNAKRTEVVQKILDNTKDIWTKETLDEMKLETLEKIEKSIVKEDATVYIGVGLQSNATDDTVAPLYVPGVEFETKK